MALLTDKTLSRLLMQGDRCRTRANSIKWVELSSRKLAAFRLRPPTVDVMASWGVAKQRHQFLLGAMWQTLAPWRRNNGKSCRATWSRQNLAG
jgi:hypothetical protein